MISDDLRGLNVIVRVFKNHPGVAGSEGKGMNRRNRAALRSWTGGKAERPPESPGPEPQAGAVRGLACDQWAPLPPTRQAHGMGLLGEAAARVRIATGRPGRAPL